MVTLMSCTMVMYYGYIECVATVRYVIMAKGEHTNTVAITPATSLCKVSRLPVNKECRGAVHVHSTVFTAEHCMYVV